MIAAFDKTIGKCRCFYTNLILDEDDPESPLFLTFDHPIPGDDSVLVVCANFVIPPPATAGGVSRSSPFPFLRGLKPGASRRTS